MKKALLLLFTLLFAVVNTWGQDINGGTSWNGWSLAGTSDQTGIYASGSTTDSYKIYTVVFTYNSGNPIPGSAAGFSNGNRILGIGVERISGTGNYVVLKADPNNNSYQPASPGPAKTSFGTYADNGDWIVHHPNNYSGQPSEITIKNTPTNDYFPCGSYGCGNGLPGIRGMWANSGASFQMFYDLTYMPVYYTNLGAFYTHFTFAINYNGTDAVIEDLPLLLPVVNTTKGTAYSTIQSAINASSAGDRIEVSSGNYYENLEINKANLTIVKTGLDMVYLETQAGFNAGSGYGGVTFLADGCTLDGFFIAQGVNQAIIHTHNANNINILNTTLSGLAPALPRGIDVGYASANSNNVNISTCQFQSLYCGVYVNQATNLNVSSCMFPSVSEGGVVFDGTWYYNNITVQGNWIASPSPYLLYFYGSQGAVSATGNTLNGVPLSNYPVNNVTRGIFYNTISLAISGANSGDVIEVAAGTYAERLNIDRPIDLRGAQYNLDPTVAGYRTDPIYESIIDATGLGVPNPDVVVEIAASVNGASINGFTIKGTTGAGTSDKSVIRCWGSNIDIISNIIDGYLGILLKGNNDLDIFTNRITANKNGIVSNQGSFNNLYIYGNSITPGLALVSDPGGIQVSNTTGPADFGSLANNISNNTITGWNYSGGGRSIGGSNLSSLYIASNVLSGSNDGISIFGNSTFIMLIGNTINTNARFGINIKGDDLMITNNVITGNGNTGVVIDKNTLNTERVTILNNDISSNTTLNLDVKSAVTGPVYATCNWWGTADPAVIAPKISGLVNWSPFWTTSTGPCDGYAPVINVTRDLPYAGIQPAITAANPGDVIEVAAGTYAEEITITKALTINGSDGATIDGQTLGAGKVGVKIKSGNVTWNNIDVINFSGNGIICGYETSPPGDLPNIHITNNLISNVQPGASHGFGIYVGYEGEGFWPSGLLYGQDHLDYSGLLISGNTITNTANAALVLQSITGSNANPLSVSNNTIYDADASGIWIDGAREIDITGNIVHSNSNGFFISGIGENTGYGWDVENGVYGPKNISITDNEIYNNADKGLTIYSGWPSTMNITHNEIYGNNNKGVRFFNSTNPLNAINNYWGTVVASEVASKVSGNVDYDPWCNADFSVCGYSATPSAFKNVEQGTYFATLQEAIDGANDGEHIQILAAGDYPGIVFDEGTKTMTVTNESGGTVTIQGASPALTVTSGSVTYNGVSFTTTSDDPAILVNGGNLTLLSCTITASGGYNQDGILVTSGSLDAGTSTTPGHNTFYTPGTGYAVSLTGGTATAIGNYWGSLIPSDIEPDINGSVAYIPWCNQVFTLCGDNGGPITYAPKLIRPAGTVVVPVTVTTASTLSLTSVSLNVDFDATYLTFVSGAPGPNMPQTGWIFNVFTAGTVTLGYNQNSLFSLSNNDVVVNLTFTYSGGGDAALTWLERDASSIDLEYAFGLGDATTPYYDYQTADYYEAGYVTEGSIAFEREYPGYPVGQTDQTIEVVHTGGVSPYTYAWTGPNGKAYSTKTIIPDDGYGNYTVVVTDFNGATIAGTYYFGPVHNIDTEIDYATIQGAIDAGTTSNGHTIVADALVSPATYNENVTVDKQLTLIGNFGLTTKPIVDGTATAQVFLVTVPNVTIDNFEILVSQATTLYGIRTTTSGTYNDLEVTKCHIKAIGTTGAPVFGSCGIWLGTFGGAVNDLITISNNTIEHTGTSPFGRAVRLNNYYGSIAGNTLKGWYSIQAGDNGGGTMLIDNNTLYGNAEINNLTAAGTFSNNDCYPSNAYGAGTDGVQLELKNISHPSGSLLIQGNKFNDYLYYGIFAGRVNNVTVDDNVFTPDANATVYRSVCLNTKQRTTAAQPAFVNGIILTKNDFKGNIAAGQMGIAFEVANYDNASSIGSAIVGGTGNENTFRGENDQFIVLNNETGTAPTTGFWGGIYGSTMAKVTTNIDGTLNLYETSPPTLPSAMTLAQLFALEDKIQHKIDDQQLGFVLVKASNAYVTDIATATATNNDYTRIRNAVDYVSNNWTINLKGTFDWTETNAAASWALGNDETSGNDDDYCILVPANLNGITFTAPEGLGYATIQGPGDLAAVNLEGFLMFWLGNNQGWTISNLEIFDFDLSIGMFYVGTTDYNNTIITNNHIRIATDLNATVAPVDTYQNMGIHYAFGSNQTISNNIIDIPGNGISDGTNYSATAGIMCNTSGGSVYDGLQITGNTINILNAQSTYPEIILGIWENAHAHSSNITITGNQFLNLAVGNNPAVNLQRGFRVTSHSSASTTVTYSGNTVNGANMGVQWYVPSDYSAQQPISMTANTFTGNWIGIQLQGKGQVTLTNNFINGNLADGIRITDPGSLVTVNNNDFSGNGTWAINNLSSVNLSATCNWYGTASPYAIAPMITGPVNYTPFLVDGTDNDLLSAGFQPVPGSCTGYQTSFYVNDLVLTGDVYTTAIGNDGNSGTPATPFRTLGHAISIASAADTIFVDAGDFPENVTVDKQLDIRGSNYNISPNTGIRVAEAILYPGVSDPDPNTGWPIMYLDAAASGTLINGFTFDGDNPGLTSTLTINGANLDAIEAIAAWDGQSNTSIKNNMVLNFSYAGIELATYPGTLPATTGNLVQDNYIFNILPSIYGMGVITHWNCYTSVLDNVMEEVRIGIQTGNFFQADPGNSRLFDNNDMQVSHRGIYHNANYGSFSPFTFSDNEISAFVFGTETVWEGIRTTALQSGAVNTTICTDNIISGNPSVPSSGYVIWQVNANNAPSITGGTVTGVDKGLWAYNSDWYWGDGSAGAHGTITGVDITTKATGYGVYINDNGTTLHGPVNITVSGCDITALEGVRFEEIVPGTVGGTIDNNDIQASAIGIDVTSCVVSLTNPLVIQNNDLTMVQVAGSPNVGISLNKISGTAATISGNDIVGPFYGYTVYNMNTATPTDIYGGTISGVMQGVSAFNANTSAVWAPSNFKVTGINMSGFAGNHPTIPAANFHSGVYVFTGGTDLNNKVTLVAENVSVDGTGKIQQDCAGMSFADFSGLAGMQDITVMACTLTNNLNRGFNIRAGADVEIMTSTLTNNGGDAFGAGGNDGFGIIARLGATVDVHNNFITNPASVAGSYPVTALFADGGTFTAFENSVTNPGTAYMLAGGADPVAFTATCNWWGSSNLGTISPLISSVVDDYIPWLSDGTDEDLVAVGFQNDNCDGNPIISGWLKYNNAAKTPMNGVTVALKSGASTITTSVTNASGVYTFDDSGIDLGNYTIEVTNNPKAPTSINSTDAAQVNYWATVSKYPIEYTRYLAGDVRGNGLGNPDYFIQAQDAQHIQLRFVNGPSYTGFDRGPWVYWKATTMVSSDGDLGDIAVTVSNANVTQNLYGQVTGDFNMSYIWSPFKNMAANVMLTYGDARQVAASTETELPVRMTDNASLGAVSLVFLYPADLMEVLDVTMKDNPGRLDWLADNGELRIGWNSPVPMSFAAGEALVTIRLRTSENFTLGNAIRLAITADPVNELADGSLTMIPDAELTIDALEASTLGMPDQPGVTLLTMSARPNPFGAYTHLNYAIPAQGHVTLFISDMTGRKLALLTDQLTAAGQYQYKLDGLPLQPGVYTATLILETSSGDMIKTIKLVRTW